MLTNLAVKSTFVKAKQQRTAPNQADNLYTAPAAANKSYSGLFCFLPLPAARLGLNGCSATKRRTLVTPGECSGEQAVLEEPLVCPRGDNRDP